MHVLFESVAAWITRIVETGGYPGIAFHTLHEKLFPPIPSELIQPVAGFLVSSGRLSFVWVVASSTVGSVLGALALYGLGAWFGERRLRASVRRYGGWLALDEADLDQAKGWFDRHGGAAVLIGRLVPSLRSLISVPAGVTRMPLGRFVLYTTAGSSVWNAILVGGGWMLGNQWDRVKPYLSAFEWATLVLLVGGTIWWFVGRRRQRASAATGA
jgi:membrane protein DedA with SNARE-associated domain